jgi:hypothetical protein
MLYMVEVRLAYLVRAEPCLLWGRYAANSRLERRGLGILDEPGGRSSRRKENNRVERFHS